MKHEVSGLEIEIILGDIAAQTDLECVVNAANALLLPGGGVAGAIHRGAGPGLAEECQPLAPINPGEAVITGGHHLPNRYVIHCLGPVYGRDEPAGRLLENCYRNALELADQCEISSIGFPSISTGVFGFPIQEAAEIALKTVFETAARLQHLRRVRFVLFGEPALQVHSAALKQLQG